MRALILAGQRALGDPVAEATGASQKALVEVAGLPMLARVAGSVGAACPGARIHVCGCDPALLPATPELERLRQAGNLVSCSGAGSPAASVARFLDELGAEEPTLVTTADHPLLTPAMLRHFLERAGSLDADVVVGVVERSTFRARFPEARRTFVPLRGEPVAGTNLFLLRTPAAASLARFWQRAEGLRKQPLRLAWLIGPGTLLGVALRLLGLEGALARVSCAAAARVAAVRMPDPEAAIDVDTPDDLELVRRILEARS